MNLARLVQLLNISTRSCSAIVDIVVYSVEITDMCLNLTKALIWDFFPGHCLSQALQTLHVFNYLLNSNCSVLMTLTLVEVLQSFCWTGIRWFLLVNVSLVLVKK